VIAPEREASALVHRAVALLDAQKHLAGSEVGQPSPRHRRTAAAMLIPRDVARTRRIQG
jgi:hypothetical protein